MLVQKKKKSKDWEVTKIVPKFNFRGAIYEGRRTLIWLCLKKEQVCPTPRNENGEMKIGISSWFHSANAAKGHLCLYFESYTNINYVIILVDLSSLGGVSLVNIARIKGFLT